jgi:hypothetical protein
MKKYFVVALSIIALSAVSCKKCQTCTTRVTQSVSGINIQVSAAEEEYCGDQYDDAPAETSVTQDVGGISQTATVTCVDK